MKNFLSNLQITVKHFLTPKEILILFFLLCITFISFLSITTNLTSYFKVERIVYSGNINEGVVGSPKITNPFQSTNQAEKNLSALLFSSLVKNIHTENGEVKYDLGLASKIETTADKSEFKIYLNPKALFSDNSKITVDDILHSLQNITQEKNFQAEKVDDFTLSIKFKNPNVISKNIESFTDKLEILTSPIISKNEDFSGTYSNNLITSGAFKINKINKDVEGNITYVNLTRYNNGESKLPYLKNYNFYFYSDEAQAMSDLQIKELNLLSGMSGQIISKVKDDESLKILTSKLSNNFSLFLNQNKNASLRDPEFRQILSEAIDRDALVNQVLGGYAVALKNILGESDSSNLKNDNTENLIKRIIVDKDNGLFFENGVLYTGQKTASSTKSKEVVKISITTINNKELVDTANFVANSWKKLGIETTIKTVDRSQLQQIVRDRDFDTLLFGFSIKKSSDFWSFFHSSERTFPKLNIANYASKKTDSILESLSAEQDSKRQAVLLSDLSKNLEADTPVIMLYKPLFVQAITGNIVTIMPESINSEEDKYKMLQHWFTDTEKVLKFFETNAFLKTMSFTLDTLLN